MLVMRYRVVSIFLLSLFLFACKTTPHHRVHQDVLKDQSLVTKSGKILILPLKVEVKELSASGTQEVVPDWSNKAKEHIGKVIYKNKNSFLTGYDFVKMPPLSEEDQHLLEQYINLSKTVWLNATLVTRRGLPAWRHKIESYDYTIGPGLSFLADKTGADKALLIIGEDVVSSSGRMALTGVAAIFGVVLPAGYKILAVTVIDLRTGSFLWENTNINRDSTSLLYEKDVEKTLTELFKKYPGVAEYKKFVED
jgi:hypothetical protein